MQIYTIYELQFKSLKKYIGVTVDLERRIQQHAERFKLEFDDVITGHTVLATATSMKEAQKLEQSYLPDILTGYYNLTSVSDYYDKYTESLVKNINLSYQRIGNGATNRRSNMASIDLLTVMEDMATYEIKALNIIRTNVSWEIDPETNKQYTLGISYIPASFFNTSAERVAFQRGVKLLKDKGLVKKTGRNDYMLNPRAILPTRVKTAIKLFDKQ